MGEEHETQHILSTTHNTWSPKCNLIVIAVPHMPQASQLHVNFATSATKPWPNLGRLHNQRLGHVHHLFLCDSNGDQWPSFDTCLNCR